MRGLGLRPRLRGTAAPVQVPFSRTRPVSSFRTFPVWRKSAGRFTLLTISGAVHHQSNNGLYRTRA